MHRTISTVCREGPSQGWQTGKGSLPKAVEAKDCTGFTENIRVVVAYAESYLWASDDILQAFRGSMCMHRPSSRYVMEMAVRDDRVSAMHCELMIMNIL